MLVIPAIDLIEGKCVRLSQGDYAQKMVYREDPLEVAKELEDSGLSRLHLVDLDGAKAQHIVNYRVLERIASHTSLVIDFGGGLKSDEDLRIAFECGASMITGGSIAVKQPAVFINWLNTYGSDRIILGADIKEGHIAIIGWTESSELTWQSFIKTYLDKGIRQVICTDIARDGMLEGPSFDLYRQGLELFPTIYWIASGGVSSLKDLEQLEAMGIPAVIVGKALYEGRIPLEELSRYARQAHKNEISLPTK